MLRRAAATQLSKDISRIRGATGRISRGDYKDRIEAMHVNDSAFWRAFEESALTHSAAHYLTTIMHLKKGQGYARVTDVAEHLGVSRGAASRATSLLKERGWIQEDPHRMLELTDDGRELARTVERNFLVVQCFLEDILGIQKDVAQEDACKLEHLLSTETANRLFRLIRVLQESKPLLRRIQERLADFETDCDNSGLCNICAEYDGCIAEETQPAAEHPPQQA